MPARVDFPQFQIIDRGIALRKNLCLPQSKTASTVLHGLQVGEIYSFTVSCVAEVEGALRHVSYRAAVGRLIWSPPSWLSKKKEIRCLSSSQVILYFLLIRPKPPRSLPDDAPYNLTILLVCRRSRFPWTISTRPSYFWIVSMVSLPHLACRSRSLSRIRRTITAGTWEGSFPW